jgi:hypothetical protein
MTRKIEYKDISINWLVRGWLLDWNANATVWANWTATNITWWTDWTIGYQKGYGIFNGSNSDFLTNVNLSTTYSITFALNLNISWTTYLYSNDSVTSNNHLCFLNSSFELDIRAAWTLIFNDVDIWLSNWKWFLINILISSWNSSIYVNWKLKASSSVTLWSASWTNLCFWKTTSGSAVLNWNLALIKIHNYLLSESDIDNYYKEFLRKLWPTYAQIRRATNNDFPKYSLPNLEVWKVLEISKPASWWVYYDQSWNGDSSTSITSVTDSSNGLNNVMSFNWSTSYISMWNTLDETWSNPFSLGCSIKFNSVTQNQMIFWKQLNSWSFGWYILWWYYNTNPVRFWINMSLVWNDWTFWRIENIVAINQISPWVWYRIVATYDWSKTLAWTKVYINWVLQITNESLDTLWTKSMSTSANFNIGARNNWNLPVNWYITNCRKYNKALTQVEIQADYYSNKII